MPRDDETRCDEHGGHCIQFESRPLSAMHAAVESRMVQMTPVLNCQEESEVLSFRTYSNPGWQGHSVSPARIDQAV